MTANENRPTTPAQLGHYTLLEEVGDGRLGKVYRARAATAVSHANVATLFEVGDGSDELFLVFEFVPGQTLDEAQGGQPLGVRQAVDLGIQIADALTALHGAGILHLDVRPAGLN